MEVISDPQPSIDPCQFMITGGFTFGFAYDRTYNPVGLVQESVASGHPVIYVSANYRVGSMCLRRYMNDIRH